jgi:DNA-binding transcriptional regulator YhcF (GntR family)
MAQRVQAARPEASPAPFRIDPDDEVPVGLQLAWRLRALISTGRLLPGDRLPSVRTLAEWSGVNVNTVRAVYAKLEDEQLVTTQHRHGTFVGAGPAPSPELERIAGDAIDRARGAGLDPRELARVAMTIAILPEGLEEERLQVEPAAPDPSLPSDRRDARGTLREQIARLEAELAAYQHELVREEPPSGRGAAAHIAGVEELERTRDALVDRLAAAREVAARRERGRAGARARLEAMVADPASRKWDTVSAPELGDPGCATYSVAPQGPLGALMRWWRVKVSSGCPLAGAE